MFCHARKLEFRINIYVFNTTEYVLPLKNRLRSENIKTYEHFTIYNNELAFKINSISCNPIYLSVSETGCL